MRWRRLGGAGIKVSAVSLGGWVTFGEQVAPDQVVEIVAAAVDAGINFFDLADVYAAGKAELAFAKALAGQDRDALVISSKVYWPTGEGPNDRGLSRKHILASIEGSLRRLGTEYIDIYFCHRHDPLVEVDEIIMAMDDLIRQGKVRYWGTSVWPAGRLVEAALGARMLRAHPPRVEQPRYNMLDRHVEREILDVASRHGMGVVAWSPLGQGVLAGKYAHGFPKDSRAGEYEWVRRSITDEAVAKVEELRPVAEDLGVTLAQLALAWILRRSEVSSVITGATRVAQVVDNAAAAEIDLDAATLERIEVILNNRPKPLPS